MTTDYRGDYRIVSGDTWEKSTPLADGRTDLSCLSSSFCLAIEGTAGTTYTFDGSSWTAVDDLPGADYGVTALSCASRNFCVAIARNDTDAYDFSVFDGRGWSNPAPLGLDEDDRVGDLACLSTTQCLAVTGTQLDVFDGSNWSLTAAPDGTWLYDLDCASATFCLGAGTKAGQAVSVSYDGANWSSPTTVTGAAALYGMSCPTTTTCIASGADEDDAGVTLTYTSGSWSASVVTDDVWDGVDILDCTSATFCLGNYADTTEVWDGTGWQPPSSWDTRAALVSVSCPSSSSCTAVGAHGAYTYDGGTWSGPVAVTTDPDVTLEQVSCTSASFCIAIGDKEVVDPDTGVDSSGESVFVYRAGAWSSSTFLDGAYEGSLSCASATLCFIADYDKTYEFDGTGWSTTTIRGLLPSQVSCTASGFCLAADSWGGYATYEHGSWTTRSGGTDGGTEALSCSSSSHCVAVGTANAGETDATGVVYTWDGTSWSAPTTVDDDNGYVEFHTVSCATDSSCMAIGLDDLSDYGAGYGDIYTLAGGVWSQTATLGEPSVGEFGWRANLTGLSCATETFCVVTSGMGTVYTYQPSKGR